jgi:uncharacterized repeat protein (TIGR02543 family)
LPAGFCSTVSTFPLQSATRVVVRIAMAAAAAALFSMVVAPLAARASSPLTWSAPTRVDFGPEYAHANGMGGVSCPSASLCVVGGSGGDVATSISPFTGDHTAWNVVNIPTAGTHLLISMSCPTAALCVGGNGDGNVVASSNPTGGGSAWSVNNIAGTSNPGNTVIGVSCTVNASTLCVAVDSAGNLYNSTDPTAASPTWHTTATPSGVQNLIKVSCASTSLCVATGIGTDNKGLVVYSTNPTNASPTWTVTADVDSSNDPSTTAVQGISCPSTTLCVAGDNVGNSVTSTNPTGTATDWHVGSADPFAGTLLGMTCQSTTFCMAVDLKGDIVYSTDPTGTWKTSFDATVPQHQLSSVACPTTSHCIASDDQGAVMTSTSQPSSNSSLWTLTGVDGSNVIRGVSCPSLTFCAAVDQGGNVLASTNPTGGASAWSAGSVDYGKSGAVHLFDVIGGIACASSSLCAGADEGGNVIASTQPTVLTYANWSEPNLTGSPLFGVTCASGASGSLCATVGGNDIFTSTNPTSGPSWADTTLATSGLASISCPTTSFCVAGDSGADFFWSTNPTGGAGTWQKTTGVAAKQVSCPTPSFCAAVNGADDVLTSTNPTGGSGAWTDTSGVDGTGLLAAISCTSASFCVAVDTAGNAFTSTNPTDASPTWTEQSLSEANGVFGISCSAASGAILCVVASGKGELVVGTSGALSHNLSVTVHGSGTVSGSGISCPGTCSRAYTTGTTVPLTEKPATGFSFAGWSGACTGKGACNVAMDADRSVTATFTKNPTGGGESTPPAVKGLPTEQRCVPHGLKLKISVHPTGLKQALVFLDGKKVLVSKKPSFTLKLSAKKLKPGRHKLLVERDYKSGTKRRTTIGFSVCRGGGRSPNIRVQGTPAHGHCTKKSFKMVVTVTGAVPKSIVVKLDGKSFSKPGKSKFTLSINVPKLAHGAHHLTITAADRFKNSSVSVTDFVRC